MSWASIEAPGSGVEHDAFLFTNLSVDLDTAQNKKRLPNDAKLDQAERFPLYQPGPLQALFERMELKAVAVRAIDIPTVFQNLAD